MFCGSRGYKYECEEGGIQSRGSCICQGLIVLVFVFIHIWLEPHWLFIIVILRSYVYQVKGFPAWPARIQGRQPSGAYHLSLIVMFQPDCNESLSGKYGIFFYGTYETASLKASEIWPFNEENATKYYIS